MHEERGVKPVSDVCDRLKVPTNTKQLAIAVCKEHLKCHQALTLKPGTLSAPATTFRCITSPRTC